MTDPQPIAPHPDPRVEVTTDGEAADQMEFAVTFDLNEADRRGLVRGIRSVLLMMVPLSVAIGVVAWFVL